MNTARPRPIRHTVFEAPELPELCPKGCDAVLVYQVTGIGTRGGRIRFGRCLHCGWTAVPPELVAGGPGPTRQAVSA
jgi:hypothetical protein